MFIGPPGQGAERGASESVRPPLRGVAPVVGVAAHLDLAEPVPAAEQGLRGTAGNQVGMGSYSDGQLDAQDA